MGIGFAVIGFGVLLGIGSVILSTLGNSVGGTANTNVQYVLTQLGTAGLAGWLPTIIAATIGIGLLLVFAGKSGSGKY